MRSAFLLLTAASVLGCAGASPALWPDAIRAEIANAWAVAPPAFWTPPELFIPPGVDLVDGIKSEEAVALALWNNAAFAEALAGLGLSRAAIVQAAELANPTASVLYPVGPKQLEFAVTLPIDVLWLRPARMAVAEAEALRAAATLVQNGLDLTRDVRAAAVDLERTQKRLRISEEARALRAEIAAIAERRLGLGDASAFETGAARIAAIETEQELTRARIAAREAEERFFSLLGFWRGGDAPTYVASPRKGDCGGELDALWREALRARPDFRAAAFAVQAANARGDLAVAEIFTLSAIYDANGRGTDGFESGPGLTAALPILNQNQAGRARADANAEVATAARVALLERAHLELAIALVRERETAAALRGSRFELTARLETRLAQAQTAYVLGEVPYVSVLEAKGALLVARLGEADLRAEHERACVEIERSIGTRVRFLGDVATATSHGARP